MKILHFVNQYLQYQHVRNHTQPDSWTRTRMASTSLPPFSVISQNTSAACAAAFIFNGSSAGPKQPGMELHHYRGSQCFGRHTLQYHRQRSRYAAILQTVEITHMKQTLLFLLLFGIGVTISKLGPSFVFPSTIVSYILYGLMFSIGINIGSDRAQLNSLKTISWKTILLPMIITIGSLTGAYVATLLFPSLAIKDSLLIASGLGYYSLSSVLISTQYSSLIGTIALLSNVMRESSTLVLAPLLSKVGGGPAIIASAGATAMDVCLPSVQKYAGNRFVSPAFVSGFVLTLCVPFLVSLLLRLSF